MNRRLTVDQLDLAASQIRGIKQKLAPLMVKLQIDCNPMQLPLGQLPIYLLEQLGLIRLPVEDLRWTAGIFELMDTVTPVLNTARSRVEQNFAAWELLYVAQYGHGGQSPLLEPYPTLEHIRPWSFASLQLENLPLFFARQQETFFTRVLRCMVAYQVPYHAVLLRLYEQGCETENEILKERVREHFDLDLSDLPQRFRELGLDEALVQPSRQIDLSSLSDSIRLAVQREPEMTRFEQDLTALDNIIREFRLLMEADKTR